MAAPTAEDIARESTALRVSIAGTAVLGLIGVAWGVVSGSQMITCSTGSMRSSASPPPGC